MANYRVVCDRVDGKSPDIFTTSDAFGAGMVEELACRGEFGNYTRVQVEIECPTHGWSRALTGCCYPCWVDLEMQELERLEHAYERACENPAVRWDGR